MQKQEGRIMTGEMQGPVRATHRALETADVG
jgi:hypothetical protein